MALINIFTSQEIKLQREHEYLQNCNVSTIFFLPNLHVLTIGPGYDYLGLATFNLGLAFSITRRRFFFLNTELSTPLHTDELKKQNRAARNLAEFVLHFIQAKAREHNIHVSRF